MKTLIAILALALLVLPMLAGIRRLRRLPPKRDEQSADSELYGDAPPT